MSKSYGSIAFTDHVRDVQDSYGSGDFYARHTARAADDPGPDGMTPDVQEFLRHRDSFYLATVSETGWPYVQHRGGPAGFLQVLDEHTLAWVDLRGNLQYVSAGNLATDDRVALIAVDYRHRRRVKVYGRAQVVRVEDDPGFVARLTRPQDDGVAERVVVVKVEAYDWNCPQHITPRYSSTEVEELVASLRKELADAKAENAALREQSRTGTPASS